MLDLLSAKTSSGDLYLNLALRHLDGHEWGEARLAIEKGLAKGHLTDPDQAIGLLREVCHRMGVDFVP